MDETVLDALTEASMFLETEVSALARDLGKIHSMTEEAARSPLAKSAAKENPTVTRFLEGIALTADEDGSTLLRKDQPVERTAEENPLLQFVRYEEPYTSVPRVV